MDDMITCQIDGTKCHSIRKHLKLNHPGVSVEQYREDYPDAPLLSPSMKDYLEKMKSSTAEETQKTEEHFEESLESKPVDKKSHTSEKFSTVFEVSAELGKGRSGNDVMVTKLNRLADDVVDRATLIPDIDHSYKIHAGLMRRIALAMELNLNLYLWGHAGTGKTSSVEQFCARVGRPYVRVQHTASTEEEHIVGATRVNESGTYFEPGILALAVKYGDVYCADEYDFAPPEIHAVYQAVLEGKPLVIKEAPPEWRKIVPHPNFRFVATGNTNGSGDESGNYAGTMLGNAANYSRFAVTEKVNYMEKDFEVNMIRSQSGINESDAKSMVEFATKVRQQYEDRKINSTIGPRELINAAKVGHAVGSFSDGLKLAFSNRLPEADADVVESVAQRLFG